MVNEVLLRPPPSFLRSSGILEPSSPVQMPHHNGLVAWRTEPSCRRSVAQLQLSSGKRTETRIGDITEAQCFARLSARFGDRVEADRTGHLVASSQSTYGTGRSHFLAFCSEYGVPSADLRHLSAISLCILMEYFIDFVQYSRVPPISGNTVSYYVTHVAEYLIALGVIEAGDQLRSKTARQLIDSYRKSDSRGHPQRTVVAIPLTYPLLCDAITIASVIFASNHAIQYGVRAALCLGYGSSLRTAEYLRTSSKTDLNHQVSSSQSFFWWGDNAICVCSPHTYPSSPTGSLTIPDHFTTFLDNRKNGEGGPKSIARCATADPDCVTENFRFLSAYPPQPFQPLLSGYDGQITAKLIKSVLTALAQKHGFDPDRMQPHASIRAGVLTQLENHDEQTQRSVGGWNSLGGKLAYQKTSLRHASRISQDIHDSSLCPISITKLIYNTPANPSETPGSSATDTG